MKKIVVITLFLFSPATLIAQDTTSGELKKDSDVLKFAQLSEKIVTAMDSKFYVLPNGITTQHVAQERDSATAVSMLSQKGMNHSAEFVSELRRLTIYVDSFMARHPEVLALPKEKFMALLPQLFKLPTPSNSVAQIH